MALEKEENEEEEEKHTAHANFKYIYLIRSNIYMKINIDTKARLQIIFLFLLQSYKVAMGSLLLLFVPRSCADNKLCTFRDNLDNRDYMNLPALCCNFITVLAFLIIYIVELKRENWFVNNFDSNHNTADNNLAIVLTTPNYLHLKKPLHYYNQLYYRVTVVTFFIYLINFILSNIILFKDDIFWKNGLTAYFSYILLILMKLYNCYYISLHSLENERALSGYMTEFTSFNVIDSDMIIENNEKSEQSDKIDFYEPPIQRNIILS